MDKATREQKTAENYNRNMPGQWVVTHVSPIDSTHQIEVKSNTATGQRYFYPQYRRTVNSNWQYYQRDGIKLASLSYGAAKHTIDNADRNHRARRGA